MLRIAVISGKGGTGKTFVSTNLARVASRDRDVTLVDCDVEEPNAHLFFRPMEWSETAVSQFRPCVNPDLCNHCGLCAKTCQFGAILCFQTATPVVPELCHGCGACRLACPQKAIFETQTAVGTVKSGTVDTNLDLAMGLMNIGHLSGVRLIRELKNQALTRDRLYILDAPPGTSCPVVATVRNCDFVLAVTEPTPMGLHDLKMAVAVLKQMGLPFGIVVNRSGHPYRPLDAFIAQSGALTVFSLPFERTVAETTAAGLLVVERSEAWRGYFVQLEKQIQAVCS